MSFNKNKNLDNFITKVNELLYPVESEQMEQLAHDEAATPNLPTLFLVGTPRSGSTLFTQWMASLGAFAYPSNFLSRFYKAPYVGALIYQMVTDPQYQYKGEFSDINQALEFSSTIGKTSGFKSPHEFWYFWRRFVDFPEIPIADQEFSKRFDWLTFKKELALLHSVFQKPFVFKAHIVNWYLEGLATNLKNAFFIHLYRDPLPTTRSLLKARENWTGSREQWFSFKPREYEIIKNMDVYHQIAGQIYFIDKDILSKRGALGGRCLTFSYEEFCQNPEAIYQNISNKIKALSPGYTIPKYAGEPRFDISNPTSSEDDQIRDAYRYFESTYGRLTF